MFNGFKIAIINWWTYATPNQRFKLARNFLIIGTIISIAGMCATGAGFGSSNDSETNTAVVVPTSEPNVTPTPQVILRNTIESTPSPIDYEELITKLVGQNLDNIVKTAIQEAMDKVATATTNEDLIKIDEEFLKRLEAIEQETGINITPDLNISILRIPTPTIIPNNNSTSPVIITNQDGVIITNPTPTVTIPATIIPTPTLTPLPSSRAVSPNQDNSVTPNSTSTISSDIIYNKANYSLGLIDIETTMAKVSNGMPNYAQLWVTNTDNTMEGTSCSSEVPYFFIRDGSKSYTGSIVDNYETDVCINNYMLKDTRPVNWLDAIWTMREPQETCIRYSGTDVEGNPNCVKSEPNLGFWNLTLTGEFGIPPYELGKIGQYILYVYNESGQIISKKVLN